METIVNNDIKCVPGDDSERAIESLEWFHSMDLGDGIVTEGKKPLLTLKKEADIVFKRGVEGQSVLDIGAWDGFFSFEAERRGAARVLATDKFCWDGEGWGKKITFETARRQLRSRVEDKTIDVFSLSPGVEGQFDTVLFLGVLYHLQNPFEGIQRAAAMTKQTLVIETVIAAEHIPDPVLYFYESRELNDDPTNYYAPNVPCLHKMLKAAGFAHSEITGHPTTYDPPPPPPPKKFRVADLYRKPLAELFEKPVPPPGRLRRVIAHAWH